MLVPTHPHLPGAAEKREAWTAPEQFNRPFRTLLGNGDFVTSGSEKTLQARIPCCAGQLHAIIEKAGQFIRDDAGEELADRMIAGRDCGG